MDLFHVQRFYGNTDGVENVENDNLEKERLESLKDKIKRKRQALQDGAPKKKKVNRVGKAVENAMKISNGVKISEVKAEKDTEMQIDDVIELRRKEKGLNSFADKVSKKARAEVTEGAGLHREKSSNEEREKGSKRRKKVREVGGKKKAGLTSLAKETEREEEVDASNSRTEHANESSKDTCKTIGNTRDFDKSYENSDTDGNEKLQNTDLSFQNPGAAKTSQIEMEENEDTHSYFKVLGSFDNKKEKKLVKRLLPKWIAEAKHIDSEMYSKKLSINDANFLEDFSKSNLKEQNIEYLFPVQSCVIPIILSQNSKHGVYHKVGLLPPDICVSAPTGSGKTLAYTLPIVQILAKCEWRRLQAIVILPSRDLAQQVKNVITVYTKGSHVKVGLASGIKSLHDEQHQLVSKGYCGFISNIDILVCTPGRLVEHINSTDGFSLEYLRFLIIDEADCLLSQSYHHWLEKIYEAVDNSNTRNIRGILPVYPASVHATPSIVNKIQLPLQKLLFSATMTHNPEKLEPLKLYKPVLFTSAVKESIEIPQGYSDVQEKMRNQRYMLPESLEQKFTVCRHSEKPLVVIYLVKVMEHKRVLCFTGSIESTHRLALLVGECGIRTAEFSSTLNQTQRKGILRDFKSGKIDLLICSDSMARGMDIENVDFVVSYDPAVNMKTYVHRVGRTARAGNRGIALTLLAPKEVYHFKKMLKDHGNSSGAHKLSISSKELEPLVDEYEIALISLKGSVKYEVK